MWPTRTLCHAPRPTDDQPVGVAAWCDQRPLPDNIAFRIAIVAGEGASFAAAALSELALLALGARDTGHYKYRPCVVAGGIVRTSDELAEATETHYQVVTTQRQASPIGSAWTSARSMVRAASSNWRSMGLEPAYTSSTIAFAVGHRSSASRDAWLSPLQTHQGSAEPIDR